MTPRIARTTLFPLAALLGLLVASLSMGRCSKKGSGGAKATKVDCNKLCDKTFGACQYQVLLANEKTKTAKTAKTAKTKQDSVALFKKLGLLKKFKERDQEKCLKGCQSRKGQFRDGKAVNACLEITDCPEFAACITRHIQ